MFFTLFFLSSGSAKDAKLTDNIARSYFPVSEIKISNFSWPSVNISKVSKSLYKYKSCYWAMVEKPNKYKKFNYITFLDAQFQGYMLNIASNNANSLKM